MKKLMSLLAAAMIAFPCRRGDQFHLYNWNNYIAPETIKRFEDSCKCEVVRNLLFGYLLWCPADDALAVVVIDGSADSFELVVSADEALDAFDHPYAYAAYRGLVLDTALDVAA